MTWNELTSANDQTALTVGVSAMGSLIYYVPKIFRKTNLYYPLIRTSTCAYYQGVRNVSFSETFEYVLNIMSPIIHALTK